MADDFEEKLRKELKREAIRRAGLRTKKEQAATLKKIQDKAKGGGKK